jgi:hypothetical protein
LLTNDFLFSINDRRQVFDIKDHRNEKVRIVCAKISQSSFNSSKVIKILFEILETHFVLEDLCVLEAILNFVEGNLFAKGLKHFNNISGGEVAFSGLE